MGEATRKITLGTILRTPERDLQPGEMAEVPVKLLEDFPNLDASYAASAEAAETEEPEPPTGGKPISKMTVAELKEAAIAAGVEEADLEGLKKSDLVELVTEATSVEV